MTEETKKVAECAICFEVYNDPRILPCSHTFCLQCLHSLSLKNGKEPGESIPCPNCRKPFVIPDEGMASLQRNLFLEKFIAIEHKPKQSLVSVKCETCMEDTEEKSSELPIATKYCVQCDKNICKECSQAHRRFPDLMGHHLVPIEGEAKEQPNKNGNEQRIKLILIGDSNVGKSSLMIRFSDDVFSQATPTIATDIKTRTIQLVDNKIKLEIWDPAGQERFHAIPNSFYKCAKGIFLLYDVTDPNSFDNIAEWLLIIEKKAEEDVVKMILGCKCDCKEERRVPRSMGEMIAAQYGVPFMETSAKDNINVERAFYDMTLAILLKGLQMSRAEPVDDRSSIRIDSGIDGGTKTKKKGCC